MFLSTLEHCILPCPSTNALEPTELDRSPADKSPTFCRSQSRSQFSLSSFKRLPSFFSKTPPQLVVSGKRPTFYRPLLSPHCLRSICTSSLFSSWRELSRLDGCCPRRVQIAFSSVFIQMRLCLLATKVEVNCKVFKHQSPLRCGSRVVRIGNCLLHLPTLSSCLYSLLSGRDQ